MSAVSGWGTCIIFDNLCESFFFNLFTSLCLEGRPHNMSRSEQIVSVALCSADSFLFALKAAGVQLWLNYFRVFVYCW